MKLKYRIIDIKTLQAKILQSYFSIEISKHYSDDSWKQDLRKCLTLGVENKPNLYVNAYKNMTKAGIDNYGIEDMDCSILSTILKEKNSIFEKCKYPFIDKDIDHFIQTDRNIDAHANGNETTDDLFIWACGSLHNIEKFIDKVQNHYIKHNEKNNGFYTETDIEKFAKVNSDRITAFQRLIVSDYQEEIKQQLIFENAMEKLSKGNLVLNFLDTTSKFNREEDFYYTLRFELFCAERGLAYACFIIGEYCFSGFFSNLKNLPEDLKTVLKQDYYLAAKYYQKGFSILAKGDQLETKNTVTIDNAKIHLISLCLNKISNWYTIEECNQFLEENKSRIEKYKVGDYNFYKYKTYKEDY